MKKILIIVSILIIAVIAIVLSLYFRNGKDKSMNNYSLWGGSAGARLSAWAGNIAKPQPSAVLM